MKVLHELELRQSLLLKYREAIIYSVKNEDLLDLELINEEMRLLSTYIETVKKNKLYFYDNPNYFRKSIESMDKNWAHAYEIK